MVLKAMVAIWVVIGILVISISAVPGLGRYCIAKR